MIYWYYGNDYLITFILTVDDLTAIPLSAWQQKQLETFITDWHHDYQIYGW
ncbi:hypothetical protein AmaxDRAFT_4597 [Limnospira maxima CS-328]|uniref:Uncharacterized protein n=1 Tax=Limnospira maxima CS-328 TaxID=513049 RepID=B5W747_LIMMA|nr:MULTISPECIES: hypothetical protein [Limnospira]EDZ92671.1 hypothetical protein AmaxDRAFT_4597 [Limnospira maxima CS-328]MDC0836534.1 hypothetical protein [Limnoraphis robusta]QNH60417.1 MAG: hypothetical protein H2674_17980 [Limnospira indica BM01]